MTIQQKATEAIGRTWTAEDAEWLIEQARKIDEVAESLTSHPPIIRPAPTDIDAAVQNLRNNLAATVSPDLRHL